MSDDEMDITGGLPGGDGMDALKAELGGDDENESWAPQEVGQDKELSKDGGVVKKLLVRGEGWKTPDKGDEVSGALWVVAAAGSGQQHVLSRSFADTCAARQCTTLAPCWTALSSTAVATATSRSSSRWAKVWSTGRADPLRRRKVFRQCPSPPGRALPLPCSGTDARCTTPPRRRHQGLGRGRKDHDKGREGASHLQVRPPSPDHLGCCSFC